MSGLIGIVLYFIIGIGMIVLFVIPSMVSNKNIDLNLGEIFALVFIWPIVIIVFVVINLYKALKKVTKIFKS